MARVISSINPATGEEIRPYSLLPDETIETILDNSSRSQREWAALNFDERAHLLRSVAQALRANNKTFTTFAEMITSEMGKLVGEAKSEIDKCAWVCDFYADNGEQFLADEPIGSDASRSLVVCEPLGTVLAVMPWNFPFWQVFRCAAPALMAGNSILLKHASNVPGCALVLEQLFRDVGFPSGVFSTLLISQDQVKNVIADARVHAVSLTGSEEAGRRIAAIAGENIKKTVLELGGSDAFVVLEDADIEETVTAAVRSRFQNCGQSCIAAKRFIVVNSIADHFLDRFNAEIETLRAGDPLDPDTTTLAPMARQDLRDGLHQQVLDSIERGAVRLTGAEPLPVEGWYYSASLLDHVVPGMPAYDEELFGPVAAAIRAKDDRDALRIANDSKFGLGGSVWTKDEQKGEDFARRMECGCAFVNGLVQSDPRLPFGGIKNSGYGRELSQLGIREFVNEKTVWIR